MDASFVQIEL